MRFPRNAKIFRGQLDAAPFASVFFVLVILLLLTSRLAFTPGVRIDLPVVGRDLPGVANPILVVAIDIDGRLYFENQVVAPETLYERLRAVVQASREPLTLVIHADRGMKLDAAVRLMAEAPTLGFKDVSLTTRRPGELLRGGLQSAPSR